MKARRPAIDRIGIHGLLSFGGKGQLPQLGPLNVLIGANASGKTNFIEALSILRASTRSLMSPLKASGSVLDWFWKGSDAPPPFAVLDVSLSMPSATAKIKHWLKFEADEYVARVTGEEISRGRVVFKQVDSSRSRILDEMAGTTRSLKSLSQSESVLAQVRDPERYPTLTALQSFYESIQFFRNWSFGPGAPIRRAAAANGRSDLLEDGGANLALVMSRLRLKAKNEVLDSIRKLYDNAEDFATPTEGGNVHLILEEAGGRQIPAARLSDGTLRYLCLLAILHHPEPPPLVVIEEPELGLHPDLIEHVAELLERASKRTQLIVTTHSRDLVTAMSDHPEQVIVCENRQGQTFMERLSAERLTGFLDKYSLGELWSIGELGGNRW